MSLPNFTFSSIIKSAKYIDVIWLNKRNFPSTVFEVEHSTDFRNSLVKFVELQDFRTSMRLISPDNNLKIEKFKREINKSAFSSIKDRVELFNYGQVIKIYNNQIIAKQFKSFFK